MLLTEEQARTKQCPLSFGRQDERGPDGTGVMQGGPWPCIASECMAWRWLDPDGWAGVPEGQRRGGCGLAGAPDQ